MRYTSVAPVLALALLATACGGNDTSEPEATDDTAAEETVADIDVTDAVEAEPEAEATEAAEAEEAAEPEAEASPAPTPTPTPTASATPVAAAAPAKAPAAFTQCKVCHSVEPGKHGIGPSLAGIYGTKAGDVEGFDFSKAMLDSGLTWDDATLDTYLKAPMKTVPGTKMAFGGVSDDAKRKEIIAYIKSLK